MPIPREVFEQTLLGFFDPIRPFLDDPSVSEIMINGPSEIYIERGGQLFKTEAKFSSHEALMSALRNLSQFVGRQLNNFHPDSRGPSSRWLPCGGRDSTGLARWAERRHSSFLARTR